MSKELKICIIGAGSTYTPELIEGIINKRESLPLKHLYLMDIEDRKLNIVGGLCKRMIEAEKLDCEVVLTKDLDAALENADFVLAQIRVGKLPARVLDEKIPLKYGLIGQETNGIGGFFKGMRTIPEIMNIVHHMEKLCPDAWLINFSNPSGMIAEAVLNNSKIKMMGLCNVPINTMDSIRKAMNLPNAYIEYLGLNHLAWVTGIRDNGTDYLQKAIDEGLNGAVMQNIPASGFSHELIKTVGAIPTCYLEYYYFKDGKLEKAMNAEKCRGEICMEIEDQLLEIYSNEVCAIIGKNGAEPIKTNCHNEHIKEIMKMMKAYEKHAVKAALTGDEDEAMRALMINPLVFDYHKAKPCFDELKEAHKLHLPEFFKENK